MSADAEVDASAPVLVVDLRRDHDTMTAAGRFAEYVGRHAGELVPAGQPGDAIDVSRLILIDEAAAVTAHDAAYARVLDGTGVHWVICVLTGMADPADRTAVVLPSLLDRQNIAVLWAGDPVATDWRIGEGPASVVRVPGQAAAGDPPALTDLLEALRIRDVFDRVITQAAAMRTTVTAPAIRIRSARLDDAAVQETTRRALLAVAGGGEGARGSGDPGHREVAEAENRLRPRTPPSAPESAGPVAASRHAAETALRDLETAVDAAGRPWSVFTPAANEPADRLTIEAQAAVERYARRLADLFTTMDNRTDSRRRADLHAIGIDLPAGSEHTEDVLTDVHHLVRRNLESKRTLAQISASMMALATDLAPAGSATRVPEVHRAVAGSRQPLPRMAGAFGSVQVVLLLLLGPLPAALAPPPAGYASPIAVALATLGAVAVRWKRRHFAAAPAAPLRDALIVLGALLMGAAGLTLGWAAAEAGPAPGEPWAAWALAAVSVLAAVLTPIIWWHRLVTPWRREWSATEALRPAVDRLDALYNETVAEWVDGDRWRHTSGLVRAFGQAAGTAQKVFADSAGRRARTAGVRGPHTAGPAPAATETARRALIRLVRDTLLERRPDALAHTGPDLTARLDQLDRDLPRLLAGGAGVDWLAPAGPGNGASAAAVIATDRPLRLLCGDDQVQLLSRELRQSVTIRFAPRAAREALRGHDQAGVLDLQGVLWTASGGVAGVVHLVPLKTGVRKVQSGGPGPVPAGGQSR